MSGILYNEREVETIRKIAVQATHEINMVKIRSMERVIIDREMTIHTLTLMMERMLRKKWGKLPPCIPKRK